MAVVRSLATLIDLVWSVSTTGIAETIVVKVLVPSLSQPEPKKDGLEVAKETKPPMRVVEIYYPVVSLDSVGVAPAFQTPVG